MSAVISALFAVQSGCPFYPRKRTFGGINEMSAKGQKRTSNTSVAHDVMLRLSRDAFGPFR